MPLCGNYGIYTEKVAAVYDSGGDGLYSLRYGSMRVDCCIPAGFFTWERVYKLSLYVIRKLPDTGKWKQWKVSWSNQIEALFKESRTIVRDHSTCCKVMLLNLLKLFWLYLTPFLCMEALNISNPGWGRIQALASIILVIIGVLPNVAGMEPSEFAFLKLFTPYIGRVSASSSLVLYRTATYFFPVAISAGVTIKIQKKMSR